ncbi:MAG: GFA family protein [Stellaceae bacterium]
MNREGGCACRTIRYKLTNSPLIVHACHCRDCQRLSGGPFAINLWVESSFVEPGPVAPKSFRLAAGSGKPHDVFFCETCGTTVWSRYHIAPGDCVFVRAGTLDDPAAVSPDVHIFTRTKLPWLELPKGVPAFDAMYKIDQVWPEESKERLRRNRAGPH